MIWLPIYEWPDDNQWNNKELSNHTTINTNLTIIIAYLFYTCVISIIAWYDEMLNRNIQRRELSQEWIMFQRSAISHLLETRV